jgi:mRNA-degrading endonuclease RelE of RelBE toxin-antitoxin system
MAKRPIVISVRITPEMMAVLQDISEKERRTIAQAAFLLLEDAIARREVKKPKKGQ